jgi:hypothetical protein
VHPCTGTEARYRPNGPWGGGRGIALPFHDHGTRRGEGSASRPGRFLPPEKEPIPLVQEAGWAPGSVWTDAESPVPTGMRSPDRPASSQSQYRLRYPAHKIRITSTLYRDRHYILSSSYWSHVKQEVSDYHHYHNRHHLHHGCCHLIENDFLVLVVSGKSKVKVTKSLYRSTAGPEGSRRLRLSDSETVSMCRRQGYQPYANFTALVGNWTRDLPACSAVLQPSAPPRASTEKNTVRKYKNVIQNKVKKRYLAKWPGNRFR